MLPFGNRPTPTPPALNAAKPELTDEEKAEADRKRLTDQWFKQAQDDMKKAGADSFVSSNR
jgi:hypothetical protein